MKDVPKAIEAVWKIESTRLIAAIAQHRLWHIRCRIESREESIPSLKLTADGWAQGGLGGAAA